MARLGFGRADDRAQSGQHDHVRRIAADFRHQRFQVAIERFCRRFLQVRGEHGLGVAGGELFAGIRGAGLNKHRPALRGSWQVQRTLHLIVGAGVTDRSHPAPVGVPTAGAVVQHRVIGPAIPQGLDHGHVLFGAHVALGMADLADAAKVLGGLWRPRRDDIPADTSAADVIQRAELPRQIIGLGIRGRSSGDQPDALGHHGKRRQGRDRFEPIERRGLHVVPQAQNVGEKDRVE